MPSQVRWYDEGVLKLEWKHTRSPSVEITKFPASVADFRRVLVAQRIPNHDGTFRHRNLVSANLQNLQQIVLRIGSLNSTPALNLHARFVACRAESLSIVCHCAQGHNTLYERAFATDEPIPSQVDSTMLSTLTREIPLRKTRTSINPAAQFSAIACNGASGEGFSKMLRGLVSMMGGGSVIFISFRFSTGSCL